MLRKLMHTQCTVGKYRGPETHVLPISYKCKIYEELKALEHQPTTRCCFDWISLDGRHAPPVNTLWVSGWRVS